jgi:hypothetical protein
LLTPEIIPTHCQLFEGHTTSALTWPNALVLTGFDPVRESLICFGRFRIR